MNNLASVAFDAPEPFRTAAVATRRPIDLTLVHTAVGGDKVRELQLLESFARKARHCLRQLGDGASGPDLRKVTSGLRNAALSVGAMRVVGTTEILETKGNTQDTQASVAAAILEAELFILKLAR